MMYESTELISTRKLDFNRQCSSLCLAIVAGLGIYSSWLLDHSEYLGLGFIFSFAVSILGVIFCLYWNGQLKTFKQLNSAKFQVLAEIAEQMAFPDYSVDRVCSINPFQREYEILQNQQRVGKTSEGMLFMKANFAETVVPKSFLVVFALISLVSISLAVRGIFG